MLSCVPFPTTHQKLNPQAEVQESVHPLVLGEGTKDALQRRKTLVDDQLFHP
jgi:hypothetical protein